MVSPRWSWCGCGVPRLAVVSRWRPLAILNSGCPLWVQGGCDVPREVMVVSPGWLWFGNVSSWCAQGGFGEQMIILVIPGWPYLAQGVYGEPMMVCPSWLWNAHGRPIVVMVSPNWLWWAHVGCGVPSVIAKDSPGDPKVVVLGQSSWCAQGLLWLAQCGHGVHDEPTITLVGPGRLYWALIVHDEPKRVAIMIVLMAIMSDHDELCGRKPQTIIWWW